VDLRRGQGRVSPSSAPPPTPAPPAAFASWAAAGTMLELGAVGSMIYFLENGVVV
jgi:hypothetical protein